MTPPDGFNRLKNCRHGLMLYNANDIYIGKSLELYGEYCEDEILLFEQFLKPGMVVLDVGANIGCHTVYFSKKVGKAGAVVAFEPQRIVFQTLCGNVALNSLVNVVCKPAAAGDAPGTIFVPPLDFTKENNFGGLGLGGFSSGEPVEVITIDSLQLPLCHFMKIDVEGMERTVLAGAKQTIARFRPALYVENDRQDRSAELVRYLDELGYRMYWHIAPLFRQDNFAGCSENVFGNVASANMFCVPKEAQATLTGFAPVPVPGSP